ncbi:TPA: TrpB-like pyridoxal phosphate-dependent enzyme [Candidatus Komeilibacteria bacterium]|nr:MAG: Tryptophan synthase beta chain [Parcubacteria group bacterium GW2011_GWF2_45_11]KKT96670.1 MAG: Tryptophan synthase beta chain [Parcubacteria group bacterium GW2011_GWC2_45_15]OGY95031.1 MAG: TrpB-like pyridoxal-phosphate dependent enzyme [Candidatus Komeilibacteria bacterium RIFOXYC2_FULL_45_12]HAH04308.1 TrpB-like pyridoxal phosphate-dependent enzyme [Candidatus Komeilibacteria bacterium]HBR13297.1 TrpB-like pyridoxal phosphate-dependent enzyme [Candidatus Komeilibacteria bacterium]
MTKITLAEKEIPTHYYNIIADLKEPPPPPIHPATREPIDPAMLEPLFPKALIQQEISHEKFIEIPDEVREIYKSYRATPLYRATRLEKLLKTPAKIYYKYEGASLTGSHKLNTALAQAYYNKQEGIKTLTTETGAGQWGMALSLACKFFSLNCLVFYVRLHYRQKPYRVSFMRMFDAQVHESPSDLTKIGRKFLQVDKNHPGSLGIAISEAMEKVQDATTKYALGSVLNHVLMHQTIIGQEAKLQLAKAGDYPDVIFACFGGGSNLAGLSLPFIGDVITQGKKIKVVAIEPETCASLTQGEYKYDFGDTGQTTPLLKMHSLGAGFIPPNIQSGGLRYHGSAPLISHLVNLGYIEARTAGQTEIMEAAKLFTQTEGLLPAPESAHAIKGAIDEAKRCAQTGENKTILMNISGHGFLDLGGYQEFLDGTLKVK